MKLCPRLGVFDSPAWGQTNYPATDADRNKVFPFSASLSHGSQNTTVEHTRQTCMCSTATHPHTVLQIRTGGGCFELLSQDDKNRLSKAAPLNIHRRILRNLMLQSRCCALLLCFRETPLGAGGGVTLQMKGLNASLLNCYIHFLHRPTHFKLVV